MTLSNAPGEWRWEQRGNNWWRIHDELNIEDGPYTKTNQPPQKEIPDDKAICSDTIFP